MHMCLVLTHRTNRRKTKEKNLSACSNAKYHISLSTTKEPLKARTVIKTLLLPSALLELSVLGLGNPDEVLAPLLQILLVLFELLSGERVPQPVAANDDDGVGREVHHRVHDGGIVAALRVM